MFIYCLRLLFWASESWEKEHGIASPSASVVCLNVYGFAGWGLGLKTMVIELKYVGTVLDYLASESWGKKKILSGVWDAGCCYISIGCLLECFSLARDWNLKLTNFQKF